MATTVTNTITGRLFLASASGLLLTAAFPKVGLSWVAWGALVPLLVAIKDLPPWASFRVGLVAGCTHYLTLVYWLADTMRTYGQLPWYVCLPVLFLFCLYLSLFTAGFSVLLNHLCFSRMAGAAMIPVLWVSLEYLRGTLLSGFPWEMLGYSQFQALRIIQISDIFGVYGVSFLVVCANAALFFVWQFVFKETWQGKTIARRHLAGAGAAFAAMLSMAWFYGGERMAGIDQRLAEASSPKIAVIQGNIEQKDKWDPAFRQGTLEKYLALSRSSASHNPALIVWPETATPFYFMHESRYSPMLLKGIGAMGGDYIIGSPAFERGKTSVSYRNRAYLVTSNGTVSGQYDKVHLVPFGEYVPFKKWLPFVGKMVASVGDFESGQAGETLSWGRFHLGMQICYEMIFPGLSRQMVRNGAHCIVNITNDAWYGTSSAPYQLFSMAIFRAVENRRSVIRAANTGISGFVDPMGRVTGATGLFEDAAMARSVPMLTESSLYTRWGDLFAQACLVVVVGGLCFQRWQKSVRRRQKG